MRPSRIVLLVALVVALPFYVVQRVRAQEEKQAPPAEEAAPQDEGAADQAPAGPRSPASDDLEGWLRLAESLEAEGDWLEALRAYRRARGQLFEELGISPQDEQDAPSAEGAEVDPRLSDLRRRLEDCLHNYQVEERFKSRDYTDSADAVGKEKALDLVEEVLERIKHFYVTEVDLGPVFAKGLRALGHTLTLPGVQRHYEGLGDEESLGFFQEDLERVAASADERHDATPENCREWLEYIMDVNETACDLPAGVLAYEVLGGVTGELDPFTVFMNEMETKKFFETFSGDYAGIGAYVGLRGEDQVLTIISPIYSGPAYRAGLRSDDQVLEIEGRPTSGKTVEMLVRELKGPAGTSVEVLIGRRGWEEPQLVTIAREDIHIASTRARMLPGKIGFVSLNQFNRSAPAELEDALRGLEAEGCQALIFDLRGNPGGYLEGAVEIADKFLDGRKLVVFSQGRNELIARRKDYFASKGASLKAMPMAVLVNGQSASASEIVSGALQQHERAVLVGEKTFGKGSVQQLMRLRSSGTESLLRLTIAKYYLPDGRSIHEKGVEPDRVVRPLTYTDEEVEEIERLRRDNLFEAYAAQVIEEDQELAAALAESDDRNLKRYPGFADYYAGLETTLPADQVRRQVRAALRQKVADLRGREWTVDLQEDRVLQQAILGLLGELHVDTASIPEYQWF